MRFSWKRWRLPLVAALTALAMSVALAAPALAAEPGESGSWNHEFVGNQDLSANGEVAQARNGGNLLDVWRGATNNIVWLSWNNGNPFNLGTTATNNSPTVVPEGSSSFAVFHVGTDNNIYYTFVGPNNNGGTNWSGNWYSVPGQSARGAVSVAQFGAGSNNLYMVYRSSTDDRVWGTFYDDYYQRWENTENIAGGLSPAAPSVTYNPSTQGLFVAVEGEDHQVWLNNDLAGPWGSWQPQGGSTNDPPSIGATADGNMLISYVSGSNIIPDYRTYNPSGNPTGDWSQDITSYQTYYSVFLSVVGYVVYTLLTGLDGNVYWKQAYYG